jgi:NurA-like 5'-3' nuclease
MNNFHSRQKGLKRYNTVVTLSYAFRKIEQNNTESNIKNFMELYDRFYKEILEDKNNFKEYVSLYGTKCLLQWNQFYLNQKKNIPPNQFATLKI